MENKIVFRIETEKPLPVEDFTKSLEAFNREYKAFSSVAELQISEIRKGSFEVEFIQYIEPASLFAGITNINGVFDFIKHLKNLFSSLKKGENLEINSRDSAENILDITRPIINNYGTINMGSGNNNFTINDKDAKLINEITKKLLEQPQKNIENQSQTTIREKVLFNWQQVSFNEQKPNVGNKGIIQEIDKRAIRVIFADDTSQTKEEMTTSHNGIDWQEVNYIVDVEVMTKDDKIMVYKILKNYPNDSFVDEDENDFDS